MGIIDNENRVILFVKSFDNRRNVRGQLIVLVTDFNQTNTITDKERQFGGVHFFFLSRDW